MKTIIDFTNKVKSLVDGRMSNIANVETSPSTHPYAVGKQLIFNGLLCKATSAIAVGDTLAVGTNLALSDNVVEQIYSLNQGLTNSLNEISDMNNVLGAKNLLLNTLSSATYNNITFTHNSDDSITITGTSTVWTQHNINDNFKLPSGTYVMSTDTALTSDMYLTLRDIDSSTTVRNLNNGKESTPFTVTDSQNLLLYVGLNAGTYNITIKPMIRPASIQDDTYVPYTMTNREMTPYVQSISNPNLLDNPWFTINQRGKSSYTIINAYNVDRWKTSIDDFNLSCTISINSDNSLTVSAPASNMWFFQNKPIIDLESLKGKTITLSVDATASDNNSGRLYSSFYSNNRWDEFDAINIPTGRHITSLTFTVPSSFVYPVTDYTSFGINIYSNKSITIHSTKLEIGSFSTLSMDTAPNYATELLKCQRYFISFNPLFSDLGNGGAVGVKFDNIGAIAFTVPIPVAMRAKPELSVTNYGFIVYGDGTTFTPSSIVIDDVFNNALRIYVPIAQTAGNKMAVWQDYKFTALAEL